MSQISSSGPESDRAIQRAAGSDDGAADGLPTPRRYYAILAVWLALFMAVLDGAIANVALPTIGRELGADAAASIWIVNAYQLAIVATLLPLASLGDKIGYHRVYIAGLACFVVGSVGCTAAQTLTELTAARVVQGLGAGGVMSINAALVRFSVPQRLLGRTIGLNALVLSVAAAAGPTIASAILSVGSWRWLFAINAPLGALTILMALRFLPRIPGSRKPLDLPSAALNALGFCGVIFGAETLARGEFELGAATLAVGVAAGAALYRRERSRAAPLVPLDLLGIPIFRLSIMTSTVSFAAQMLAFVALPFHLQTVLGRSAVETGLLMTPWPIAVGIAAPVAGRLADRYSAGLLGGIGLLVFACGLAALATMPAAASDFGVAWRMALCGLGFGLFQSPNNRTIVSSAPRARSGAAGGMLATARLVGQTAGAVGVAVLFHLGGAALTATSPTAMSPTTTALGASAVVALLAAGVSLLRLRNTAAGPPDPARDAMTE